MNDLMTNKRGQNRHNRNARRHIGDLLVILVVFAALFWLLAKAQGVSYKWDWPAVGGYLIAPDGDGGFSAGLMLEGLLTSLRLLVWGGIIAMIIGLAAALAALSRVAGLRWLALVYVESLRNLPPIVFMFIFYFFISAHVLGGGFSQSLPDDGGLLWRVLVGEPRLAENFIGGALCLGVFEGAFFAEVFRAGIAGVSRGQWDGAHSVGLGRWKTLRLIILPQAARKIAAPAAGQTVLLIKDSAILSVISVEELAFSAQETAVSTNQVFEVWIIASLFYFALCWPLLRAAAALEKRAR